MPTVIRPVLFLCLVAMVLGMLGSLPLVLTATILALSLDAL
jgi:hypothetical protein